MRKYFPSNIQALGNANRLTDDEAFAKIVEWYDGYRFEENAELVINPVSLGQCFQKCKFADYWSKTALPTFLIDILRNHPLDFSSINIEEDELETYEPESPKFVTLLSPP